VQFVTVNLARFLAELHRRVRRTIPDEIDPIGIILTRVGLHPHTPESKALVKGCLAVIDREGTMSETDLLSLSGDAVALLDRFAIERLANRYRDEDLATVAKKLGEAIK